MTKFSLIINKYIDKTIDLNSKRIMQEALNLIEDEQIISEIELQVLNEIFISLREDFTIIIMQDEVTLDFLITLQKQQKPIIKNEHNINTLINDLKRLNIKQEFSNIENMTLNFLDACEHIEETEIFLIQNIIRYLENNWILKPIETKKYNGEQIRYSKLIPTYCKTLIKN